MSANRSPYSQLQPEDRLTIASLLQQRYSVRGIARILGRCASTISREIARNSVSGQGYASRPAQQRSEQRRRCARPQPKLHPQSLLWQLVVHFLRCRWSPEQIALTLSHLYPKGHELRVSHETIYNCIYAQPVGELRKELIAALRQAKNKRLPRSKGKDRRGQISAMLSIHMCARPRLKPASPQGSGKETSSRALATPALWGPCLVERTSRLLMLVKLPEFQPASHASLHGQAAWHCPAHAPKHDVRPRQRNGATQTTHPEHGYGGVLL